MKKKRKLRWLILLLAVMLLGAWTMLRPRENTLYAVTVGDIQTTYSFTGSLAAPRSQTIVSTAAGRVKEVYVEANELVEEGDRILALSTGEIIRAEIDGEVVSLSVEKDEPVAMGDMLAMIIDLSRMEAEVSVDEYDVDAIELNREVSVTVNALDETCAGTIKSFSKVAASMGTMAVYQVNVGLEIPEKALPGMQVEVIMLNQSAEDTLLLKADALQFDEKNQVYVLTKNAEEEYVPTYIETGINDGTSVQILSGLTEGQTVYYSAGIDIAALMEAMRGAR